MAATRNAELPFRCYAKGRNNKNAAKACGKKQSDISQGPLSTKVSDKDIPEQLLSHYTKKQLNLALAQYNQALTLNSHSAFAYRNRGQVIMIKENLIKLSQISCRL